MSKNGGDKSKKVAKKSSGLGRQRRANKELRKLKSNARRWKRYNDEAGTKAWDMSGISKRMKQLESIVAMGSTTRV